MRSLAFVLIALHTVTVQDSAAGKALGFIRSNIEKTRLNSGSPFGHATYAIAGLAMLACGISPEDAQVQKAAGVIEAFVNKTYEDASKDKFQSNWILGFGGLFFAEMAARGRRNDAVMKKIVELLENHQTKDGGWGHQKAPTTLIKGYPDTFFAPTNWCAAALGALKRQSIAVNPQTIDRVIKLFETGQAADGGYEYDPFRDKKRGEAGRTGAAVFAMALLDRKESPAFKRAVDYLKANMAQVPDGHSSPPMHIMSAALAMAAVGDSNAFSVSLGRLCQETARSRL
jgi:hypothetical protein